MRLIDKLNPKKLFKATVPDLRKYIGRTIIIDQKPVVIQSLVGNKFKKTFYEVNGEHLIGMLRFHAQMEKDDSITEDQFVAFETMEVESEKMPDKKTILEMPHGQGK